MACWGVVQACTLIGSLGSGGKKRAPQSNLRLPFHQPLCLPFPRAQHRRTPPPCIYISRARYATSAHALRQAPPERRRRCLPLRLTSSHGSWAPSLSTARGGVKPQWGLSHTRQRQNGAQRNPWTAQQQHCTQLAASPGATQLAASPVFTQLAASPGATQLAASPVFTQLAASPGATQLAASPVFTQLAASPGATLLRGAQPPHEPAARHALGGGCHRLLAHLLLLPDGLDSGACSAH
jgi:hypothetical protein